MGDRFSISSFVQPSRLRRTASARQPHESILNHTMSQESTLRRRNSATGRSDFGSTLSIVPRAATIGPRRGTTPLKTDNPPKPTLTAEQKLAILDRLESGNYIRGRGIAQFHEEYRLDAESKANACKQNLATAFAKLDNVTPIAGATGGHNEANLVTTDWTDVEAIEENYSQLPVYIKEFDQLLVMQETLRRDCALAGEKRGNVKFAKTVIQSKIVPVVTKMNKTLVKLERMLKAPNADFDMLKLFKLEATDQNGNANSLPCDIKQHKKAIQAISKVPELLDRLNRIKEFITEHEQKPMDYTLKMKDMAKMDALEEMLRELNTKTRQQSDLLKKMNLLGKDGPDSNTSSDSLGDFFDGLSDVSSPSPKALNNLSG
ncbi:unnamed protein product [Orchesella dallaii]|uniref:Uncharacterized protein n=1 Tax=Orchesella dallaii TaxID=48710 RepID=A0ABP1PXC8_9HEXA